MSSRFRPRDEPGLFDDLPLQQSPRDRQTPVVGKSPEASPSLDSPPGPVAESLPLFSEDAEPLPVVDATRSSSSSIVPANTRLAAGLIDLGVVLAVMLTAWAGLWWLGVESDLVDKALVLVFLLPFSFLYQTFPLAFWGCTPGMARVGIVARNRDGQALSFSQAALRWLASVLTVSFLGLPLILMATSGRSLADRFSGSQTQLAR